MSVSLVMDRLVVPIFEVGDYEAQVSRAAALLREGQLVVLPTETVYGAAAALRDAKAVEKLRQLRHDEGNKPLTLHVSSARDALPFLSEVSELGKRMMNKLWPGPVALVFEVSPDHQAKVAAEQKISAADIYSGSQITLRCPDHVVAKDVLEQVGGPVVLTMVPAGDWASLPPSVSMVLDTGPTSYSKPSTIVRVTGDRFEIEREGVYDKRIIERLLRTTVLFVCSGNTCRSPMAEALARRAIADRVGVSPDELDKKGISVLSAGSFAMPGARATPAAVDAVREFGGDLSRHRSQPLSVELIHQADYIFTMGRSHADAVRALVPLAGDKTITLSPDGDIEDPIGGDAALYDSLAKTLSGLIDSRVVGKVLGG